ncbi:MAG: bifunctional nicotinamidase/pyrazinamidase [Patescibacteria group bacterium]
MKALIVVDVQSDFADKDGTLYVPKGEEVVPTINRLITSCHFPIIVLTQDWHCPGHGSFASSHKDKKPGDIIDLNGIQQTLWLNHCEFGTKGAAFHKSLLTGRANLILRKGCDAKVDSYSGFKDNAKHTTGLAEYLEANNVSETYICGLATDYCCKYTALDSFELGFKTYFIEDACRAVNIKPTDGRDATEEIGKSGVVIIDEKKALK